MFQGWNCLAIVLACAGAAMAEEKPDLSAHIPPEGTYDVRILRDTWGVPHIYGRRDVDVAYGLAWAQCEDDFPTLQETQMTTRGVLASVRGISGAPTDFAVQAFKVYEFVNAKYETDLSPEVRAICEAYAAGANHYAATHPEEIESYAAFPCTGKDIVAGFVLKLPMFYGLDRTIMPLISPFSGGSPGARLVTPFREDLPKGSNAIAVAPSRSADGYTRLDVNSHQPWEGPVAWYEVRLHSEEGWDMTGGVFPGTPVILHGHNRNLGWAHTVNQPDLADVYALEINPENKYQYRFDGAWRDFEVRQASIQVLLFGSTTMTIPRELLYSVHGPAFRTKDGVFAVRFAGYGEVRAVEQVFRMNKARNLAEFRAAMEMRAQPSLNTVYADKEGNIWYLFNGAFPQRAEGYDWRGILPGNTSATLLPGIVPFDALPQVLNPPSGWVFSCNNDPCFATSDPHNVRREDIDPRLGVETFMTNRALRCMELFGADTSITREEFYQYKFDWSYSKKYQITRLMNEVLSRDPGDDPLLKEAMEVLRGWDYACNPENTAAAIAVGLGLPIIVAQLMGGQEPNPWDSFTTTAKLLKAFHGRVAVPWSEVNRIRRGTVDVGLGGGPDTLYAVYGRPTSDGRLKGEAGDSYVLLVEWDPQGRVKSESLHQYGSATSRPESPHYADQIPLFVARTPKPVWFEEHDLRQHLAAEYRPGAPRPR
jgi:penicillin amidase/acyl-homoserine-lactone acylase